MAVTAALVSFEGTLACFFVVVLGIVGDGDALAVADGVPGEAGVPAGVGAGLGLGGGVLGGGGAATGEPLIGGAI